MGTRPHMNVVFGIDTFEGALDYDDVANVDLSIPDDLINRHPFEEGYLADAFRDYNTKMWASPHDVLYWGGFNNGDRHILGMKTMSSHYDSDLIRALCIFHPRYKIKGKTDIPVSPRDAYPRYAGRIEKRLPQVGDIKFQWSWFYPPILESHSMWPVIAYATRHLLDRVGWSIDPTRYKAMLVWDWC